MKTAGTVSEPVNVHVTPCVPSAGTVVLTLNDASGIGELMGRSRGTTIAAGKAIKKDAVGFAVQVAACAPTAQQRTDQKARNKPEPPRLPLSLRKTCDQVREKRTHYNTLPPPRLPPCCCED
ncbi:hypothetical protein BN2476_850015 [Paraburkholderia piptadeniae]|uniref:Uncharacterized protein n=1 Tax=Paraburkholderia piptadeniae TaxID=1701573 RepID=A0A1N7STA3_9BURK|nr:hypothetical protein BN2476_850015 [Paraburkholderia piptadeniae]